LASEISHSSLVGSFFSDQKLKTER